MLPQLSQPVQQLQFEFELDKRINNNSNKKFVLLAKSVSVADATTPINNTNKISLEKFIFNLSYVKSLF